MDIYVGNLAYATTDDELRQVFERHGAVESARVVVDRVTGRSKGFGFVVMPSAENSFYLDMKHGENYLRYVGEELPQFMEKMLY